VLTRADPEREASVLAFLNTIRVTVDTNQSGGCGPTKPKACTTANFKPNQIFFGYSESTGNELIWPITAMGTMSLYADFARTDDAVIKGLLSARFGSLVRGDIEIPSVCSRPDAPISLAAMLWKSLVLMNISTGSFSYNPFSFSNSGDQISGTFATQPWMTALNDSSRVTCLLNMWEVTDCQPLRCGAVDDADQTVFRYYQGLVGLPSDFKNPDGNAPLGQLGVFNATEFPNVISSPFVSSCSVQVQAQRLPSLYREWTKTGVCLL